MRLSETIVDGVVVGQGATVDRPKKPKKTSKMKLPLAVLVIVLALLVAVTIILVINHDRKNNTQTQYLVCGLPQNEYLLREAASNLEPDKIATLKPIVTKIQKLPNFQKDQNCDYVALIYYLNSGNAAQTSSYLSKLEQVYNPKYMYNRYIQPVAIPIGLLKNDVNRFEAAYNQTSNRARLIVVRKP